MIFGLFLMFLSFLLFFCLNSQIIFFRKRVVIRYFQQKMSYTRSTFFIFFFGWRSWWAERLIIENFEFPVYYVSFSVLPFRVHFLNLFLKNPWAVLMVEIILFKGKHFTGILMMVVHSFQVLLSITQVLSIFISDIGRSALFVCYLCQYIWVVVSLWRWVLIVKGFIGLVWIGYPID